MEYRGYVCDGIDCQESIVLEKNIDSITRYNWYHIFSPAGQVFACSAICVISALSDEAQREERMLRYA